MILQGHPIKANDFHVIWKPICDFLLLINSNLGRISHRLITINYIRDKQTDRQTDWQRQSCHRRAMQHSCSALKLRPMLVVLKWRICSKYCFALSFCLSCLVGPLHDFQFLRAKAAMLSARLSHRNSVRPSVCPSVRHTGVSGKNGAS